jgi:hypothetical protein
MSQSYNTTEKLPYKIAGEFLQAYLKMSPGQRRDARETKEFADSCSLLERFHGAQLEAMFGVNLVRLCREAEVK